jgi:hypothetical protein
MVPDNHKDKYFFHFTHIENLESICRNGILSTNMKKERGIVHKDVANPAIQERRSNMDVTCEPYGKVHDYVPFYWCSINPMLLSLVNAKNIDQQDVVFLAIPIEKITQDHVVFTNSSANTNIPPEFYNQCSDLDKLDWKAIESKKWGSKDEKERHQRMSEVLIYGEVPFSDVEYIITWNNSYKKIVQDGCNKLTEIPPKVVIPPFKGKYFYFTQFPIGRPEYSLVTGPYWLKRDFNDTIKKVIETRKNNITQHFKFKNIENCLSAIEINFNAIQELEGIFELETINDVHSENVSDHTLKVLEKLKESKCFNEFEEEDQQILKLAAYLHDIGKGPKSRWEDGIQPVHPDHPVDALPMLQRILIYDIEKLKDDQIKMIILLVAYHDLIGEIIGKGRDLQQLFDIINNERELEMLSCLNRADVAAIDSIWSINYNLRINEIKKQVIDKLNNND